MDPAVSKNLKTRRGRGKRGSGKQKKDEGKNSEEEKKTFRFQGRMVFLTYSKCNMTGPDMIKELNAKGKIYKWVYGQEKHADGTWHLHVLLHFEKVVDTERESYFDVMGYHPCIVPANFAKWKAWWEEKQDYCMKDGLYEMNYEDRVIGRDNYIKRKADAEAWKSACDYRQLKDPYPLTLPGGKVVEKPGRHDKLCNYLIVGPPDLAKSEALNEAFDGKRIYSVTPGKDGFDQYQGEELILFDDIIPKRSELFHFLQYRTFDAYMPSRYHNKKLKKCQRRAAIIICNYGHEPEYVTDAAFLRRFNIIRL